MFYLITDPECNDYVLLESAKDDGIITHVYVNSITANAWLHELNFAILNCKSIIHRPLKDYVDPDYQLLFKAASIQKLTWLIDQHPEVFI